MNNTKYILHIRGTESYLLGFRNYSPVWTTDAALAFRFQTSTEAAIAAVLNGYGQNTSRIVPVNDAAQSPDEESQTTLP